MISKNIFIGLLAFEKGGQKCNYGII